MKKVYISAIAIFLFAAAASAQSLSPTVIASTGAFVDNGTNSLSYTVGEMTMVQTFTAGNNILTQGFQQPNDLTTGLLDITHDAFGSFVVYPNPAVTDLSYGFVFPEAGKVSVVLYNELGQKISDLYNADYTTGKTVQQLNVQNYAAGVYFLTANFVSANDGKVHVISKKFQVIN